MNSRAVALQGVGFRSRVLALQGFSRVEPIEPDYTVFMPAQAPRPRRRKRRANDTAIAFLSL